eukprot:8300561-Heterocapsa_arctica.AAC.1
MGMGVAARAMGCSSAAVAAQSTEGPAAVGQAVAVGSRLEECDFFYIGDDEECDVAARMRA